MRHVSRILCAFLLTGALAAPGVVLGQPVEIEVEEDEFEPGRMPEPRTLEDPRIVEMAGDPARPYGSAGVLELGGWASFNYATGFTLINFNPQVGFFVMDNVRLAAIVGLRAIRQDDERSTFFNALVEPSFHIPFADQWMGFFGAGVGPNWSRDESFGLSVQPRVGINYLVGRSGIFSPAVFASYSSTGVVQEANGGLLGVDVLWGVSAGYTVMW